MVEQSTEGLLQSIADKITKLTEVDTSPQKQLIQRDVVLFFLLMLLTPQHTKL